MRWADGVELGDQVPIEEHGLDPDLTFTGVDAVVGCGRVLPGAVPDGVAARTGRVMACGSGRDTGDLGTGVREQGPRGL